MKQQQRQYFVMNKASDFLQGCGYRVRAASDGVRLCEGCSEGVYYTRVFDSREKQMQWHRLCMEIRNWKESFVRVTVYTSESPLIESLRGYMELEKLIADDEISEEEKELACRPYARLQASNPKDILLHTVQGRYLWMRFSLQASGKEAAEVTGLQIFFPKSSWLGYLPELYSQDRESAAFLDSFLGIFQSFYEDMTDEIKRVPDKLCPARTDLEILKWLADWFAVDNRRFWNEAQLRYLIANAARLYRIRGTRSYLEEMVRLHTGRDAYIVEHHQIAGTRELEKHSEELKRLYSSDSYEFTVLIDDEDIESANRRSILEWIVDMAKPAGMDCKIVVLKPYIFLDQYSYIGINSVLGQYKPVKLDGLGTVPYSMIADE